MRLLVLVMMMLVTAVKGMGDDAEEWERLMGEPMDKSRWIDPWDMGLASDKETRTCSDLESRVGTCEQELTACKETLESSRAGCNKSAAEERLRSDPDVFLRRYINHLVYKLGLELGQESHLKLEVYLSPGQTQTLLNFAKFQSPTPAVDVDTILSSLIRNVESYETSPFVDNLKVWQNQNESFAKCDFFPPGTTRVSEGPSHGVTYVHSLGLLVNDRVQAAAPVQGVHAAAVCEPGVALGAALQGRPRLTAGQADEGRAGRVQARGDELPPVSEILYQSGLQ